MGFYRAIQVGVVLGSAAWLLAACTSENLYTGGDAGGVHRFTQLGRRAPVPEPAEEAPATVDPAAPGTSPAPPAQVARRASAPAPAPAEPVRLSRLSLDEARRRVDALLSAQGFEPEDASGGHDYVITATRMQVAHGISDQALCRLKALNRPQMYAATVNVRLAPTAEGVQVGVEARFEEMDQNLVSGDLTKYPCRSRGLLEAEVRRAATGG